MTAALVRDDTGAEVTVPARVSRVVSLVPSLTETVAVTAPGLVAVPVWVTVIRTLDEALVSLRRLLTVACQLPAPAWLDVAEQAWEGAGMPRRVGETRRAIIPIWRRPWMVLGRDTFAGDMLARLGVQNMFGGHAERYPKIHLDDLLAARPDLVVLPDEPYRFTAQDGPGCFPGVPAALVSGRHLTWYGPSLAEAPRILSAQLAAPRRLTHHQHHGSH